MLHWSTWTLALLGDEEHLQHSLSFARLRFSEHEHSRVPLSRAVHLLPLSTMPWLTNANCSGLLPGFQQPASRIVEAVYTRG